MVTIFFDESGGFVPVSPPNSRVSCVAALILRSELLKHLSAESADLKLKLPLVDGEIKGSRLNETDVARVLALLARYDALVEVIAIHAGAHRPDDVTKFRQQQAVFIGQHARRNADPRIREVAERLRSNLERMPNQLFMQAWITMLLVQRVVQTALLYYSVEAPRQLSGFRWVIDAKASTLTPAEDFWATFVLSFSQTRSRENPILLLEGANYSYFSRFIDPPELGGGINLGKILTDELVFEDSADSPGLQLVDVVANTTARAFNGRLAESGWLGLANLLAGLEPQVIQMASLTPTRSTNERQRPLLGWHAHVMKRLYSRRKLVQEP